MLMFLLIICCINLFFFIVAHSNGIMATLFFKLLPVIGSIGAIILILKTMEVL